MLNRILKKVVNRIKTVKNEIEYKKLKKSYSMMIDLSKKGEIKNVSFGDRCVITFNDGRKYYFDPYTKINKLYSVPSIGVFEPEETECVTGLVKENDICIDVGGSFGWYSLLLSNLAGKDGAVHSFEPIKENFEALKDNIELNEKNNIYPNNFALGQENTEIEIFLSDIDTSGSLKLRKYKKNYDVRKIDLRKLDDYVEDKGITRIDFIKADVEGAEFDVVKGGLEAIKRFSPILFLEIQKRSTRLFGYEPEDLFNYLFDLGYKAFVYRSGELCEFIPEGYYEDYNFFFIKK